MKKIILLSFLLFTFHALTAQVAWNMELLGQFDDNTIPEAGGNDQYAYNDIWGYAAAGREYAITGSAAYVHFFDVTDPTTPTLIDQFAGGDTTVWRDMKVYGNYAYSVSDGTTEGMMIFDLSYLPDSVVMVKQTNEFFDRSHNIFIDEPNGRLYAVGCNVNTDGAIILDVATDPANPTLINNANMLNYIHDIYVRDNIAYSSQGYDGYYIWDLNDAMNPVLLGSRVTGGYNHSSWISDDGTWGIYAEEVPQGLPLGSMDLSDVANLGIEVDTLFQFPLLENQDQGNTPHNPFIIGNYAYVSYYEDGLQVIDMTDPESPVLAGWYDTYPNNTNYSGYFGCWGTYPFLPSGNILANDRKYGLHILNFDPNLSSTDELTQNDFNIYPNPSSGIFNILMSEFDEKNIEFDVFDLSGKNVFSQQLQTTSTSVDLSFLPNGFYFGKIKVGEQAIVKKLVVSK